MTDEAVGPGPGTEVQVRSVAGSKTQPGRAPHAGWGRQSQPLLWEGPCEGHRTEGHLLPEGLRAVAVASTHTDLLPEEEALFRAHRHASLPRRLHTA